MEDLLKRTVSNQQTGLGSPEFRIDQLEAGTSGASDTSSNLDRSSVASGEGSQASDYSLPSPEGKSHCVILSAYLMVFSTPQYSRKYSRRIHTARSEFCQHHVKEPRHQSPSTKRQDVKSYRKVISRLSSCIPTF